MEQRFALGLSLPSFTTLNSGIVWCCLIQEAAYQRQHLKADEAMHSLYDDLHETHAHHAHHTHTGRGYKAFLRMVLIGFCLVPATLPVSVNLMHLHALYVLTTVYHGVHTNSINQLCVDYSPLSGHCWFTTRCTIMFSHRSPNKRWSSEVSPCGLRSQFRITNTSPSNPHPLFFASMCIHPGISLQTSKSGIHSRDLQGLIWQILAFRFRGIVSSWYLKCEHTTKSCTLPHKYWIWLIAGQKIRIIEAYDAGARAETLNHCICLTCSFRCVCQSPPATKKGQMWANVLVFAYRLA